MVKEWSDKFNPFNSDKLLAQIYKWRKIKRGNEIPPPTTISVDPINGCDIKCCFCNADFILKRNHNKIEKETLYEIADFFSEWGVETTCVGGGGESLLNPYTGEFLERCVIQGVGGGIVTNGTNIHKHFKGLADCNWVGISVDAGTRETYKKIKGKDRFKKVISNIEKLVTYSEDHSTELADLNQSIGVGFKFLLHPYNVDEVYGAAKIAKEIGCTNIHIRPVCVPWDKLKTSSHQFKDYHLKKFETQLKKARTLEDGSFGVYGITHKFDKDFKVSHNFKNCYAIFMTCVIMPPTDKTKGKFDLGFCCDRRGDDSLTLKNLTSTKQIKDFWGSKEHWKMFDRIKLSECPRCTYSPHNQIYENVIQVNKMSYNFI